MIYTSYYAKLRKDFTLVSISVSTPKYIKVDYHWPDVKPKWEIVEEYKRDHDEEKYTRKYIEMLDGIDFSDFAKDLEEMSKQKDIMLLCYEKTGDFCHRHILAKYLNEKYNLNIQEYEGDKK